jgi:hypothetical protein
MSQRTLVSATDSVPCCEMCILEAGKTKKVFLEGRIVENVSLLNDSKFLSGRATTKCRVSENWDIIKIE